MSKQVKLECYAETKEWKNPETGEILNYISISVMIKGQPIKLSVPKDSRQLFNYLTKDMFE